MKRSAAEENLLTAAWLSTARVVQTEDTELQRVLITLFLKDSDRHDKFPVTYWKLKIKQ